MTKCRLCPKPFWSLLSILLFAWAISLPSDCLAKKEGKAEASPAEKAPDDGKPKAELTTSAQVQQKINAAAKQVTDALNAVLFVKIPIPGTTKATPWKSKDEAEAPVKKGAEGDPAQVSKTEEIPMVLLVLVLGGIFFTFRFGFINIRLFTHAIAVIRGKFDRPEDEGEITHFQALTSALSATVGLGNIAGVALAIGLGGPGAVFWMWFIAFFGMSAKFASCSCAQLYRRVNPDGTVLGGPMIYLEQGIKEKVPTLAWLGKFFGIMFACFTVLASFGGGNMFQGNQTFQIMSSQFSIDPDYAWLFGVILAILVGAVIIGGIKRIGDVTCKLVPLMCVFYCGICCFIIFSKASLVPTMIASIVENAFNPTAMWGGSLASILIIGAKRAAFSNEAGLGSAAIAHSAAKTDEPMREGIVAMVGPFIDTIVVCTMTALTLLITNSHLAGNGERVDPSKLSGNELGVQMTATAFATVGTWAPYMLCVAVCVFAYSTIISWSYYGEKASEYLFGKRGILPYRIVFIVMVVLGPILSLKEVLEFSDTVLISMAFPNILGLILLSGMLNGKLKDYVRRLRSGEMKPVDD